MKMNKTNKKIFIIFSMFLIAIASFSGVIAQPPFEQVRGTGIVEYIIEFPKIEKTYVNESFYFSTHVTYSNGTHLLAVQNKSGLDCHLEGYAYNGSTVYTGDLIPIDDEYINIVPAEIFQNEADGYYTVFCVDEQGVVGLNSNPFVILDERVVEDKNLNFNLDRTENIVLLCIVLAIVILLVYLHKFLWAGIIIFLTGLMLLTSGANIIFSVIVFFIGIVVITGSKGD